MIPVLETLMRSYTGVFSFATPIDEEYVATKSGVSVKQLRELLYGLSINHIIKYIPTTHANVIYILHDRLHPGNVQLSPKRYELLKSTFGSRIETMTEYVQEKNECRSCFLLRYFGEEKKEPCGKCDICRSGKELTKLRNKITEAVKSRGGEYTLSDVQAAIGPSTEEWTSILRQMVDDGELPPPQIG